MFEKLQDILNRLKDEPGVHVPAWTNVSGRSDHWSNTIHEQIRRHLREDGARLYGASRPGRDWLIPRENVPVLEAWIRRQFPARRQ